MGVAHTAFVCYGLEVTGEGLDEDRLDSPIIRWGWDADFEGSTQQEKLESELARAATPAPYETPLVDAIDALDDEPATIDVARAGKEEGK